MGSAPHEHTSGGLLPHTVWVVDISDTREGGDQVSMIPTDPAAGDAPSTPERRNSPVSALFWRLVVVNALAFTTGAFLTVITLIAGTTEVDAIEIPILILILVLILVINAYLVRRSLVWFEAQYIAGGAQALAAQEAERQRVARELHDEIGQSLTVALLSLKRVADRAPAKLHEEVEFAQAAVRDSLEDVRQVARRLRPGVLAELGLRSALKELATDVSRTSSIPVNRMLPRELPDLGGEVELVIYRVAQEALTNVVRHAQAMHASLTLKIAEDRLILIVSEDGQGGEHPEGVGILGMRERAALIGAKLAVGSSSFGGTEVRLTVPLSRTGRARR